MRDDLVELCANESNRRKSAVMREEYWKKKFESEALEMDEEDQADLVNIFQKTNLSDVPTGMLCLWQQQQRIIRTDHKNGYRWHPK